MMGVICIVLDSGGLRRGPPPFRFLHLWLKEEGFKDFLKTWWEGFDIRGSYSFILTEKLKALKANLRKWTKRSLAMLQLIRSWP